MNEPFSVDQYRAFLADERERLAMAENAMTTWRDDYDRLYQEIQVLRAQCAAQAAALAREKQHSLVLQFALMLAADCTCCVNEPSGFCEMPGCECPCCQSIVEAEERIARAARAAVGLEPP